MKSLPRTLTMVLAATASGWWGSANAEEFTLLLFESPAELDKRTDTSPSGQAYWAEYADYGAALASAGILRGGAALGATDKPAFASTAPRRAPDDAPGNLELGGYFVIDVADIDAALAWAFKAPTSRRGGRVDVHAAYPAPTMQ